MKRAPFLLRFCYGFQPHLAFMCFDRVLDCGAAVLSTDLIRLRTNELLKGFEATRTLRSSSFSSIHESVKQRASERLAEMRSAELARMP